MKGFFRSNTFKVLLIAVLVISGILALSVTTGSYSVSDVISRVLSPMQSVSTRGAGDLKEDLGLGGMSEDELKALCGRLSDENKALREQLIDYYDIKQQNEQYAEELQIKEKHLDLELAAAAVIGRDPIDAFGGFSIDKGYINGVQENDPVITDKGIVGIVSKAYASSSRVTTILSEDVKIGAIAKEFMESGVVESNVKAAGDDLVMFNYLNKDTRVAAGTVITTSGAGGTFPPDLLIGSVSYLGASDTDVSVYAVVQPFVDVKSVSNVFVVTNFPGKEDEAAPLVYSTPAPSEDGESGK